MRTGPVLFGVLLLCCCGGGVAAPVERPHLEIGIGGLGMVLPDYRGSDYYGTRALPIPYVVYRSERVQVTRSGLRARLLETGHLTASFSGAGSLPGTSDNPDRAGMPRIDPTFELGPSLDYDLHGQDTDPLRLKLRAPLRAVVAADGLHFHSIGWTFVPHLRLDYDARRGRSVWSQLASLGLVWSSEDFHEYFYGVDPAYATLTRPAYDAHGGYSGLRATWSTVLRRERWRYGAFLSYDWLAGSAARDSPLMKTDHAVVAGFYVTYRLFGEGVDVRDD